MCTKTANKADLQGPAEAAHEGHGMQLIQSHIPDGKVTMNIKWKFGEWRKKAILRMLFVYAAGIMVFPRGREVCQA